PAWATSSSRPPDGARMWPAQATRARTARAPPALGFSGRGGRVPGLHDLAVFDAEHVAPRRGVGVAVLVLAVTHEGEHDQVPLGDDRHQAVDVVLHLRRLAAGGAEVRLHALEAGLRVGIVLVILRRE